MAAYVKRAPADRGSEHPPHIDDTGGEKVGYLRHADHENADEALKVFCLESDDSGLGAGPSVDSFKVLFQFAARTNEQGLVRSRVKRYLPKLWEKLPDSLRGMS